MLLVCSINKNNKNIFKKKEERWWVRALVVFFFFRFMCSNISIFYGWQMVALFTLGGKYFFKEDTWWLLMMMIMELRSCQYIIQCFLFCLLIIYIRYSDIVCICGFFFQILIHCEKISNSIFYFFLHAILFKHLMHTIEENDARILYIYTSVYVYFISMHVTECLIYIR